MSELEFYKYINEKSILVSTQTGVLKRIYCPFAVMDITNRIIQVDAVAATYDDMIYYLINSNYINYKGFKILN